MRLLATTEFIKQTIIKQKLIRKGLKQEFLHGS
jgi:hypothetical protein